jgi:hypothetical protein
MGIPSSTFQFSTKHFYISNTGMAIAQIHGDSCQSVQNLVQKQKETYENKLPVC